MTIPDVDWNAGSDPHAQDDPTFATTPAGSFAGGNLTSLTWDGRNYISGILEDQDKQIVVLIHDTTGAIEHMDQFHNRDDSTDLGVTEWRTYTERFTASNGDDITVTLFAAPFILSASGDDTLALKGLLTSFPNNEYRVRVTRAPIYFDADIAQLVLSVGNFLAGDLTIWDVSGLGTFYEPRDFLDKDALQAASDKAFHHRMSLIAERGKTIEDHVMRLVGQTPDLATIRPSDTNSGVASFHIYAYEDVPERSDLVLSSDTLAADPHVLSWELRQGVVEPVTGIEAVYGHYHRRKDGASFPPSQYVSQSFPLDYKTGEDRFTVAARADNIAKIEFPEGKATGHNLDRFGILAQFPIWTKLASQDEISVGFDWYGLNFMPGDLVYVHIDGIGWDETNGEPFIVTETSLEDAFDGVVEVTLRRAWGVGRPHPYLWRDSSTTSGSQPATDWPFLYSTENLRLTPDGGNVFGNKTSDHSDNWLNAFANVRAKEEYAAGTEDEHMVEFGGLGTQYRPHDHDDSVYEFPGVRFLSGGQQPEPNDAYPAGDALLWWVWRPHDLTTAGNLLYHDVDGTDDFEVQTVGTSGQFEIVGTVGGVAFSKTVTGVVEESSGYVIAQFGGTNNRVNVSGTESSATWSSFPGVGTTNPIYFGTDGSLATGMDAHIAEMGLVMPQGGAEDVDTMYDQLEAYIKEKYGIT